jgi:lipopolysaccharide assembly protein A
MRVLYAIALLLFAGVIALFAYQNQEAVTLTFLQGNIVWPLALVIGVVYALGMLSGWSVFGFLRRSWHEVAEHQPR